MNVAQRVAVVTGGSGGIGSALGGIYPLSGPASAYGTISKGVAAYFKYVNDKGGIDGRKVQFVVRDDGYQPPKAVEEARRLVEQEKVFAVFQTLGTPSTAAVWDYRLVGMPIRSSRVTFRGRYGCLGAGRRAACRRVANIMHQAYLLVGTLRRKP